MTDSEIPLIGGRVTPGVVRVGATVHRPQGPQSAFAHRLLGRLAERGFAGAPQFLGVDDRGREILSFLPGDVPPDLGTFTAAQFGAAGLPSSRLGRVSARMSWVFRVSTAHTSQCFLLP